jgi:prephenate dehydrogenase
MNNNITDSNLSNIIKPAGALNTANPDSANNIFANKKVTIIGLGLIGGSLARALRERLGIIDITAINRSTDPIKRAVEDGSISRGFNELNDFVWDSDIIFICTPVKRAVDYIEIIAKKVKPGCIITDVGSTKSEIIEYINNMPDAPVFIGGHPMAGTEKTGYSSGFSHIFENAFYILSPSKTSTTTSLQLLTDLVMGIGAIPVTIEAHEHDKITACISHVPHIIASALVNLVKENDSSDSKMQLLAAGGFKDITRIASSSPEMWENIVSSNTEEIGGVIESFIEILEKFKHFMKSSNSDNIYGFFKLAKEYRDSFTNTKKGLINPVYEIVVDVIDKPGIIGEIASILANNSINIKNINISNNREFEQGCLRITLSDSQSIASAFDLLSSKGYKVHTDN